MPKRLLKLAATLDRLRDVLAARLAKLEQERTAELRRRAALEELLQSDTRFLDLTLDGGLRRLHEISARVAAIDQNMAKLRKRSADAFLKAGRARQAASLRAAEMARVKSRLELAEIAGRHAAASLGQANEP